MRASMVVVMICASLPFFRSAEAANSFSLQDIQDGIKQHETKTDALHLHFETLEGAIVDGKTSWIAKYRYEAYYSGKKLHYFRDWLDVTSDALIRREEAAWNGEIVTSMGSFHAEDGSTFFTGTIQAKKGGAFRGYWSTVFGKAVFDDVDSTLVDIFDQGPWHAIGTKRIADGTLYGIEAYNPDGNRRLTVWVSPEKDFSTVELTYSDGPTEPLSAEKMDAVQLKRIGGTWVPESATITIINPGTHQTGITKIKVSSCDLGSAATDDFYTIKFKAGTKVWDDIKQSSMIAGEGVYVNRNGRVQLVNDDAAMQIAQAGEPPIIADKVNSDTSSVIAKTQVLPSSHNYGWLLIWAGVVLALAAAAIIFNVFRRRRLSGERQ